MSELLTGRQSSREQRPGNGKCHDLDKHVDKHSAIEVVLINGRVF